MTLELLPGRLAVCRLAHDAAVPGWAESGSFTSVTRTPDELSVVCDEAAVPSGVRCERGWRALRLHGTFEFSEVGVLLPIVETLARGGVSILPLATFDTDYVLIQADRLAVAREQLAAAGHRVEDLGRSRRAR